VSQQLSSVVNTPRNRDGGETVAKLKQAGLDSIDDFKLCSVTAAGVRGYRIIDYVIIFHMCSRTHNDVAPEYITMCSYSTCITERIIVLVFTCDPEFSYSTCAQKHIIKHHLLY
jgi:hypothetical protein